MKQCENYEDALLMLGQILILRRSKKLGVEELSELEMDRQTVLMQNILLIAEENDPENMSFYTSDIDKDEDKDKSRSVEVYKSTKKSNSDLIFAFEKYLKTCDLKYLSELLELE